MDTKLRLIEFIQENVDETYAPDQDRLVDIMDSVSFLRLIMFIEDEIGQPLDMSTATSAFFEDLDSVIAMIKGYSQAG